MGAKDQWRSRICFVFLLLVGSHLMLTSAIGTSWWALGVSGCSATSGNCPSCTQLNEDNLLNEAQRGICQEDGATVTAISRGARKAIIDCQAQFKNLKWNCSTFYGDNLFGSFVNQGTRETAVLSAYMSAGATQGVAEACHDQKIEECPCEIKGGVGREEDAEGNIIFNTCNDNIDWALRFVQGFVDNSTALPSPSEATARDLMDIHNNRIGRRIVSNRTTTCVCHGISGTCTVQTCYKKVPDVGEIGSQLHIKYDGAVKVRKDSTTNQLVPERANQDQNVTEDLVFSADSPNFCRKNEQNGILGTQDRLCDKDSQGPDGCSVLCCGRGFYRSVYTIPVTRCQFVWCCRIECGVVGNQTIIEHRCN